MRRIGVVTFSRSDYSSYLPVLRAIRADTDLALGLMVSGMHLSPEFGETVAEIERDGFDIQDRIDMLLAADTPAAIAKSIGIGILGLAQSLSHQRPDILLLVGDRFELLSVVAAALPFGIPLAHISGGDITEGASDNQIRHAITKMSHLHFVSMQEHANRLIQMGEESWRVNITGDPAIDLINHMEFMNRDELSKALNHPLKTPLIIVTYHPTTLSSNSVESEINCLLSALDRVEATLVITYPNADSGNHIIIDKFKYFLSSHKNAFLYQSLGQQKYYSLMALADLMIGNSSSGIWEAPSFKLPAINLGDRQGGRKRAGNVLDVGLSVDEIARSIQTGLSPDFRNSLKNITNPYGDGHASARIIEKLKHTKIDSALLKKKFADFEIPHRGAPNG